MEVYFRRLPFPPRSGHILSSPSGTLVTAVNPALVAAVRDRYRMERELGSGGMAIVYLAEDLKHRRKVALKVLRGELAAALGPERFIREIEQYHPRAEGPGQPAGGDLGERGAQHDLSDRAQSVSGSEFLGRGELHPGTAWGR